MSEGSIIAIAGSIVTVVTMWLKLNYDRFIAKTEADRRAAEIKEAADIRAEAEKLRAEAAAREVREVKETLARETEAQGKKLDGLMVTTDIIHKQSNSGYLALLSGNVTSKAVNVTSKVTILKLLENSQNPDEAELIAARDELKVARDELIAAKLAHDTYKNDQDKIAGEIKAKRES